MIIDGIEVGRESGEFELAGDFGIAGIRKVDDEQWIDLAEGDEIAAIAFKARGVNLLGSGQTRKTALDLQRVAILCEDHHIVRGVIPAAAGGGDAESAGFFIHGELIEDAAGDLAAGNEVDV